MKAVWKQAFNERKPQRDDYLPVIEQLWQSGYFEERQCALYLTERIADQLTPADVPWLHEVTRRCEGWVQLDHLAARTLGPLALNHGEMVYEPIRAWAGDDYMWTRRASVLAHLIPARKARLNHEYSWPTWEQLLPEREFFIRKAIGWALREASKQYPQEVFEFLQRVGDRASGLTRREGSRNLPD
jgi:3-methyladenine DNA glycosylase AlkD